MRYECANLGNLYVFCHALVDSVKTTSLEKEGTSSTWHKYSIIWNVEYWELTRLGTQFVGYPVSNRKLLWNDNLFRFYLVTSFTNIEYL